MTAEIIELAPAELPAALSDELQGIARRYVDARRRVNEGILEAAAALAEARATAKHGEWLTFLQSTNTGEDFAKRMLNLHDEAQRTPALAESVKRGWLPFTQAALLAAPSTPPEAREQVLSEAAQRAEAQQPPPSKREVEQQTRQARGGSGGGGGASAPPNSAPVRDSTPPPTPTPSPMAPLPGLAPAPAAAEQIAELPAAPPAAPTPLTPLPVGPSLATLRQAEATVALLEQALVLAESERDRVRREVADAPRVSIPDEAVEVAARTFIDTPAVRAAASFLAMRAL